MARVDFQDVSMRYGGVQALEPIDLHVGEGEFLTLLGPSGCGKTTTLRIGAGFLRPTTGRLLFDGQDVTALPPQKRQIGMVFQDYALFPHLTVAENIGFALKERKVPRAGIRSRVAELLAMIRLPEAGDRLPSEISGGQQQRVAFARAIAHPPKLLLMDEPLAALDLKLREAMQSELRQLQRQLGITTLFVTHDQGEAMLLSDRIAVMDRGRVMQVGTARDIYDRPNCRFVAEFVGRINLLPVDGVEAGGGVVRSGGRVLLVGGACAGPGTLLGVRPQQMAVATSDGVPERHNRLEGVVTGQAFSGNLVHLTVASGDAVLTVERRPDEAPVADGTPVVLHWRPEDTILLAG